MAACPRCGAYHEPGDCPLDRAERDTVTAPAAGAPAGLEAPVAGLLAGRYRVEERIGRGGMGEVYRAHDLKLDAPVALKLLPGPLAHDPERLARLLNEVRVARQVSHPNVCRVYDVAESDGRHFLTMELIDGETLDRRIRRKGKLAYDEALSLARQIALGLAAAHERGVLHRDLKPGNVMVDERGVARITDFGLGEAAGEVAGERAREGTPLYMAPEALEGGRVTAKSDLFSLGMVLRELFTGAAPREIPSRVVDLIARCLEANPAKRPTSARAVADGLPGGGMRLAALAAAQGRADRIAAFRAELRDLRAAGVTRIDPAEDERIAAHHDGVLRDLVRDYDVDVSEREKQLSLGMRIVSILGAIALAASVFYFFYRIWGSISFPTQLAVLIGAPIVLLVFASWVSARDRSGHVAAMAAVAAFAAFVSGLSILGFVLNVRPSPYAQLVWGVFALIIAYGFKLRLPLAIGLAFLGAFAAAWLQAVQGLDWMNPLGRPEGFLPFGVAAFTAPAFGAARRYPPFAAIYRLVGATVVLAPLLVLSLAPGASLLPFPPSTSLIVYSWIGLAASAGAIAIGVTRRYVETTYCGFALMATHLFVRCFDWWWAWMPRYLFFLILAGLAVGTLGALRRLRSRMSSWDDTVRP